MSEWVALDQKNLNRPHKRELRGVEIDLLLSPYDIPDAVRGGFNASSGQFLIEFKYISDEHKYRSQHHGDHLVLRVGKNSGRLLGIEVDIDGLGVEAVALKVLVSQLVEQAIGELAAEEPDRRLRYDLANRVITERSQELFEELVAS